MNQKSENGIISTRQQRNTKFIMEQALERSYLDMDIPIQKNETEDAFRGMKNLGCVQGEYNRKTQTIDEFDNNRLNGYKSELQYYGEFVTFSGSDFSPVYSVDAHHRFSTICDSFYYDSNLLFERAEKENIREVNFGRVSNEDFYFICHFICIGIHSL